MRGASRSRRARRSGLCRETTKSDASAVLGRIFRAAPLTGSSSAVAAWRWHAVC
ncbi:MAG: hypothetical protein AVDCRST_MAG08-2167 [uncultured Acetobacteraceae bacterium]|uniref:Uncharacterized protein n=1 Tax=uncultured Acetobacteraceae bacterium TaxID=169975 RepID=A0A6J4IFD4_9PROT|nr:MAG: hypothetical protein AVDCRST_MAG08-2167 [uncultured Acetobacteraceae bacterium]